MSKLQQAIAVAQTELGNSLTAVFSSRTGNSSVRVTPMSSSPVGEFAWIRHDFEPSGAASLYLGLAPADLASESVQQTLMQGPSAVSSLFGGRSKEQASAAKGFAAASRPNGNPQFGFEITGVRPNPIPVAVFISDALLASLAANQDLPPSSDLAVAQPANPPGFPNVNNLELLLDVEMPVSISFGRAQLPLKDVLKLNIGSLVELDRTVSDPVEIIVSNSVIARGEVVVVDGNLGVRIDQVMSRQERLRNLV